MRRALPLLLVAPLAACGGNPPTIGPTGVDGLTVPTPSPDPAAYVGAVDHPQLTLVPGTRWELADATTGARLVLEVLDEPRTVAGLAATGVEVVPRPAGGPPGTGTAGRPGTGTGLAPATAWFAQDRAGHVWLVAGDGPAGSWEAGLDGAEAGLALAAEPRVGDGHVLWAVGGEPAASAQVLATGEEVAVPWGVEEGVVPAGVVTLGLDLDPAVPGPEAEVRLAEDVGPVVVEDRRTGDDLVLVARS